MSQEIIIRSPPAPLEEGSVCGAEDPAPFERRDEGHGRQDFVQDFVISDLPSTAGFDGATGTVTEKPRLPPGISTGVTHAGVTNSALKSSLTFAAATPLLSKVRLPPKFPNS